MENKQTHLSNTSVYNMCNMQFLRLKYVYMLHVCVYSLNRAE